MITVPLQHYAKPNSSKKVERKVQGVPQSQVAVNPWHQVEEERDKNQHVQNTPALSSPSEVIAMLKYKTMKITRQDLIYIASYNKHVIIAIEHGFSMH